jgi:hypothetical protein
MLCYTVYQISKSYNRWVDIVRVLTDGGGSIPLSHLLLAKFRCWSRAFGLNSYGLRMHRRPSLLR